MGLVCAHPLLLVHNLYLLPNWCGDSRRVRVQQDLGSVRHPFDFQYRHLSAVLHLPREDGENKYRESTSHWQPYAMGRNQQLKQQRFKRFRWTKIRSRRGARHWIKYETGLKSRHLREGVVSTKIIVRLIQEEKRSQRKYLQRKEPQSDAIQVNCRLQLHRVRGVPQERVFGLKFITSTVKFSSHEFYHGPANSNINDHLYLGLRPLLRQVRNHPLQWHRHDDI